MQGTPTRILVVGAYGLIGSGLARALAEEGHSVTCLGRNQAAATRVLPGFSWHFADMRSLTSPQDWRPSLGNTDFVINAAGVLDNSPLDDLAVVHSSAVGALAKACGDANAGLIHISAAGVSDGANTAFFRTKAAGERAIRAAAVRAWILRPGLVIAPNSYGGTALIRMLAAIPWIQPIAFGAAPVQSVALSDVAAASLRIIQGQIPPGTAFDLVEDTPRSLASVVAEHRAALGFQPGHALPVPKFSLRIAARIADALGKLGWRSPLRTPSMRVLETGVVGDPEPYKNATGKSLMPLGQTLRSLNLSAEHRLAARTALLMPIAVATLTLFWMLSGLVALWNPSAAAEVLTTRGWSAQQASASVISFAIVDIVLGALVLYRPYAALACWGMVAISALYLAAATIFAPGLWADPLGPLLKVFPGLVLALTTCALLESR